MPDNKVQSELGLEDLASLWEKVEGTGWLAQAYADLTTQYPPQISKAKEHFYVGLGKLGLHQEIVSALASYQAKLEKPVDNKPTA